MTFAYRLLPFLALFLAACFQTEHVPGTLLVDGRIEYEVVPTNLCGATERVTLHVPRSTRFDSLRLCVASEFGQACEFFNRGYVQYFKDSLSVDFLMDAPRFDLVCTTYYRGKRWVESFPLQGGEVKNHLALPESLSVHFKDKALRYAYDTRKQEYVSSQFKGLLLESTGTRLFFLGSGPDSMIIGGRIPPAPVAVVSYQPAMAGRAMEIDTLFLSDLQRKVTLPGDRDFETYFVSGNSAAPCGKVEFSVSRTGETSLFLGYYQGMIRIPPDSGRAPELCYGTEDCRSLEAE